MAHEIEVALSCARVFVDLQGGLDHLFAQPCHVARVVICLQEEIGEGWLDVESKL